VSALEDKAASEYLLTEQDPPAFELVNPYGRSNTVLICDHASNRIPLRLGNLGLGPEPLMDHVAWDPGAAAVARVLSELLGGPLGAQRLLAPRHRLQPANPWEAPRHCTRDDRDPPGWSARSIGCPTLGRTPCRCEPPGGAAAALTHRRDLRGWGLRRIVLSHFRRVTRILLAIDLRARMVSSSDLICRFFGALLKSR